MLELFLFPNHQGQGCPPEPLGEGLPASRVSSEVPSKASEVSVCQHITTLAFTTFNTSACRKPFLLGRHAFGASIAKH